MKVIKRSGAEVNFDITKIIAAVGKANETVGATQQMSAEDIREIASNVETECAATNRAVSVEEIQDMVELAIMAKGYHHVAKNYITYRYTRSLVRKNNTTDDKILSLIERSNEEAKQENANKNPVINSTQRDYMAGEVSRDLTERILLPKEIVEAHREGIIHFHDSDYFAHHMSNCDLVNLDDMLQNGTVITNTMIEHPRSFATACNIATQIVAQVASNQYGGQTISLTHLAPFVDVSRKKLRAYVEEEFKASGINATPEQIDEVAEIRVRDEVRRGVQTIQYQVLTLLTTNGQTPFITVFMYLGEARNEQEKKDLALIIEETLKQRYEGVKNESGVYITPSFPKLIYVLEEQNIGEDSPYFYLTELAAKCTARRMVPDYISEKKMLELKGDVYPCMGCVAGDEVITYRMNGKVYVKSFSRAWNRMIRHFEIKTQPGRVDDKYIDLTGVEIFDCVNGWTKCYRMIRNSESDMLRLKFSNGRTLDCTPDHPFETENRGVVYAADLSFDDIIAVDTQRDWEAYEELASKLDTNTPVIKTGFVSLTSRETLDGKAPSYDVTTESEHFAVSGIYSHNCRSFLTPDRFTDKGVGNIANAGNYEPGKHKYYGRWNQGVVTINLPDVALSSGGNIEKFWTIFEERLELCHRALRCRHERLKGTPSDVAPIIWQYGACARLKKGETIDKLLYDGYSTISLGYAGLYECVKYMTGKSHTDPSATPFALSILQKMNDMCAKWKSEENIDYSIYGTPWI